MAIVVAAIKKMVSGGVAVHAKGEGFLTQGAAAACGTFRRAVLQSNT